MFDKPLRSDFNFVLFDNDFLALIPELFLVLVAMILLLVGSLTSLEGQHNKPILVTPFALLGVYSLLWCLFLLQNTDLLSGYVFYNCLVLDPLNIFLKKLLLVGAILALLISIEYNKKECINHFELVVLIILSLLSMVFMVQSADLISLYLSIELQSLCFYVMAALKSNSPFSSEAGLKYFLLGAFSSGILLLGCSLVYGFTGVTEFINISKVLSTGFYSDSKLPGCELGLLFILVAFLFKITAVPFHVWAPDVYEGAPTSITAYFSIAPKVALLGIMIKIFGNCDFYSFTGWQKILIFSSLASMLVGSFAALSQNKIKRMLAFSSIGHVGYMLVGLCLDSLLGVSALCVYMVTYVLMTVSVFALFLLPLGRLDPLSGLSLNKVSRLKYITDLTQLGLHNPALAATLTVTMFSMAGIPPLAGFYAKANIFLAALSSSQYLLAVLGVLTSVVSSYYYIRLVKVMYFEKTRKLICFDRLGKTSTLVLSFCFFFITAFMIYPSPLYLASHLVGLNTY